MDNEMEKLPFFQLACEYKPSPPLKFDGPFSLVI